MVVRPSEGQIQSATIAYLRGHGFIVLQTSVRVRTNTGQTPGIPDLLVSREEWPAGAWIGFEVKAQKGVPTPEQELLLAQGRTFLVRDFETAVTIAKMADKAFKEKLPPFRADQSAINKALLRIAKHGPRRRSANNTRRDRHASNNS